MSCDQMIKEIALEQQELIHSLNALINEQRQEMRAMQQEIEELQDIRRQHKQTIIELRDRIDELRCQLDR